MVGFSIKNRYTIRAVLGRGGMGVVYHAFDTVMRRDVAVKTILDVPSGAFLELFSRECSVLSAMVHPNVVEIFDMGEFDDEGVSKPFFVMPLLPGTTLHDLIYSSSAPLSAPRCIDIISQACRGLQAAHEHNLIHQDIKPRNIFVMRDDAVKIIDFGVAHLGGGNSTGIRGTLKYMSPEQITFKGLTSKSDIFSLAVVCYEALTAAHPFVRRPDRHDTEGEIAEAITSYLPPLASELNPSVNRSVAQVVAKGMAKDVWNRYESAATFAEALQKALRNENPAADNEVVRARLERARRSFEQNDLEFASEIVSQMEAEGHSDGGIADLRKDLDEAVQRQRSDRLIAAAERCFLSEEYTLALRKVQEVLDFDRVNASALALKARIEDMLTEQKIAELLRAASDHLDQSAFTNARHAVQDALKLRPSDTRARHLLNEVDSRQKEVLRQRQEQERLHQAAQSAFFSGKIDLALKNLEQLSKLTAQYGERNERSDGHKELYRRVRTEYDALKAALAQAQALLDHDLPAAQKICDRYLTKYSDQPDFIALSQQIERRREELAQDFRRGVAARVESEDNPEIRLRILEDALKNRPKDEYFQREIENFRKVLRTLTSISDKARTLERKNDFPGALNEWETLRSVYPRFPGLNDQIDRVTGSLEKLRAEQKAKFLSKVEDALNSGSHDVAGPLLSEAETEFPADSQLAALRSRLQTQTEKGREAERLLNDARQATQRQNFLDTSEALAAAAAVSGELPHLRRVIFEESLVQAELVGKTDWRTAKIILDRAAGLGSGLSIPARYLEAVRASELDENVLNSLKQAVEAENANDLLRARTILLQALDQYPDEKRLQSSLAAVEKAISEIRRKQERDNDLQRIRALQKQLRQTEDPSNLPDLVVQGNVIAQRYRQDPEITLIAREIETQVSAFEAAAAALAHGDVETCFHICDEVLASYPDDSLFLNLKSQADVLEQERATEFLESVAHQLATEPDLSRRGEILEAALRKYPNEQFFADEVALVKNEQALVQTVADRARRLENDGLIAEALEQWIRLKTLYSLHIGVDLAIDRCHDLLRKQQEASRLSLRAAIDKALNDRDYGAALERLREAQAEFPEDPDLKETQSFISRRIELYNHAAALLKAAEADFIAANFQSGLHQIRQALKSAEDEPDLKKTIASVLIRYAPSALSTDVPVGEAMVAEAKLADPAVAIQKQLRDSLLEARARLDQAEFRSEVGRLEAGGDFAGALDLTRDFLARYSSHAEAMTIQKRLLKAKAEAEKKRKRVLDLSDLGSIRDQAKTVVQTKHLLKLSERAQQIAKQNASDQEVTRVANTLSSLLSALAQLQKLTEEGRLKEAEEVCNKSLVDFPQEQILAQWRTEIGLRQQAQASEYLRHVEQKLAAEQDFLKHEQILKEAIRAYPQESYYSDELALVRSKQSLLEAEVARARDFETKELYEDACHEWESIRKAYPWYAGVDSELDRLHRAWDLRTTAIRNSWLTRIHKALAAGDVDLADSVLQDASIELVGDPVLNDLQAQIQKVRLSQRERSELVSQGRQAFRDGRLADGASLLGQAINIFKEDIGFRDWVLDLLLNEARSSRETSWQGSELLLQQIARIHPGFAVPVDLQEAIAGQRRESEIILLLQQVERAESAGDLQQAKHLVEAGIASSPRDQRIIERRSAILDAIRQLAVRKEREQAFQKSEQVRSELHSADSKRKVAKLRSGYISQRLVESSDPDTQKFATQLLAEIDLKLGDLARAPEKQQPFRRFWYIPLVLAILAASVIGWYIRKPIVKDVAVTNAVLPVPPRSPIIQIAGNIPVGDIYLDDVKVGALTAGSLDLLQLSPGAHILRVSSGEGVARVPLFQDASVGPRINAPVSADRVSVTAVSTNAQAATLTTSITAAQPVLIDNKAIGSTSNGSLVLPVLQPGNHHLQIGPANDGLNFDVAVQANPSISLLIAGSAPTGRLDVKTNVAGADVFIDGKKYSSDGERAFRLILPAKTYEVYAAHDGYSKSVPTRVDVSSGSQVALNLRLLPINAVLKIPGSSPGTQINLDGSPLGKSTAGATTFQPISPGSHVVEIVRQGFISKQLKLTFDPGHTVVLTSEDLSLSAVLPDLAAKESQEWNSLKTSRSPSDLQAFVRHYPNGPHTQAANQTLQELEWDGVDKTNATALEAYSAKHPEGAHTTEARQLVEQLNKSENTRHEQTAWDSVDKRNKDALQTFINKYANGGHAPAARQMMADLMKAEKLQEEQGLDEAAWRSVNRADRASLDGYLNRFPNGRHASQAQAVIATLTPRQSSQTDSASVLAVLQRFAAAWTARDLSTIASLQPSMSRRELKSKFENVREWNMTITPIGAPQIDGDHASVSCRRKVNQTFSDGTRKELPEVTITYILKNQGSGWVIEDVR